MLFSFHSLRAATAVLALASLAACSSKKDAPAPTPAALPGMAWAVDGITITALATQAQPSGTYVSISGSVGTTSLLLYVPNVAGTYALDNTSFAYAGYTASASNTQAYHSTSGTIVVSSISATNVTGTFAFQSVNYTGDTRKVTKGTFNVNF